jgi:hypothetical protein
MSAFINMLKINWLTPKYKLRQNANAINAGMGYFIALLEK